MMKMRMSYNATRPVLVVGQTSVAEQILRSFAPSDGFLHGHEVASVEEGLGLVNAIQHQHTTSDS